MSWFLAFLFGYMALALQATFVPHVEIAGFRPDLPLIVVVILSATRGAATGIVAGFLIGLGQDLTNPAFLGLNALAKSLLGYAIGSSRERFDAGTTAMHAGILFAAMIMHDLVYLVLYTKLALTQVFQQLAARSFATAIYTSAVGMWFFTYFASRAGKRGGRYVRSRLAG